MSFHFKYESQENKTHILYLSGEIDENADFSKLPIPKSGQLTIDLKNITLLNSLGLRTWVQWIDKLRHLGGLFLRQCPNVVVHQINILEGFLPMGAIVESIVVPYYCESCGHETSKLIKRGVDYLEATADSKSSLKVATETPCEKCGQQAEADFIATKHFKFLQKKGA